MSDVLNKPDRVIDNILSAHRIMRKVDSVLGEGRLQHFAVGVSAILAHMEPSGSGLCAMIAKKDVQYKVFEQIHSSATELQTGWNCLRLANVPASQRQGRIAMESIGLAVVFSLPTPTLLRVLSPKDALAKWLRTHSEKTATDAHKPMGMSKDESRRRGPPVKATEFFASFVTVAEEVLQIPPDAVQAMRDYRAWVQHPAAHASAELSMYHFETLVSGAAGALFDPARADTYTEAADDLRKMAFLLADVLDVGTKYMAVQSTEPPGDFRH